MRGDGVTNKVSERMSVRDAACDGENINEHIQEANGALVCLQEHDGWSELTQFTVLLSSDPHHCSDTRGLKDRHELLRAQLCSKH